MPKLLLTFAAALALGAVSLFTACGETTEEVLLASPTATPTPAPAPTVAPTLTPTSTPTSTPPADSWKTYTDPVFGFSLKYPPDLVYADTGSVRGQRALVFRSPTDPYRPGFTVGIVENSKGLTLDQWVQEFTACLPKTIQQGTIAGTPAIFCTSQPEEIPEAAVAFEHMGTMFLITSIMPAFGFGSEFDLVVDSIRL